ncbi:hypothetical protein Z945_3444 [Sulfitobacter noctilucae]|nr:hypothetical protein Z945_3444 [Sulfitobacter noctilucae]
MSRMIGRPNCAASAKAANLSWRGEKSGPRFMGRGTELGFGAMNG